MGPGWRFFGKLNSRAVQPFSPAVVIKRGRLRQQTRQQPFRVLVDEEGECLAWWPGEA